MAHKKQRSKYISFLIVSEDSQAPRTIRLRKSVLRMFLFVLVGIAALIIIGAATYWKVASLALENNRLQEENFKLRKGLDQLEELKKELGSVQKFKKQIKGSLNGYVTVESVSDKDSFDVKGIDFDRLSMDKRRTIFNSIPSLQPVEGFLARGFDARSLLASAHLGVDIAAPTGKAVLAPADGVVMFSDWTVGGGNVLIINHGLGYITLYKHNERNMVRQLERVSRGQVIALLGNTGDITSGPHLHYEIWKKYLPVNPLNYITVKNKE